MTAAKGKVVHCVLQVALGFSRVCSGVQDHGVVVAAVLPRVPRREPEESYRSPRSLVEVREQRGGLGSLHGIDRV